MSQTVAPCRHMKGLLGRWADGGLPWLLRAYVEAHLRRCPQCTAAMRAFLSLRDGLRSLGAGPSADPLLSEEQWAQIERACRPGREP
jgi:anti-sigma factor RsiW